MRPAVVIAAIFVLPTIPRPSLLPPPEKPGVHCPKSMVHVTGRFCPHVEQTCTKWIPNAPGVTGETLRCAEFSPTVCKAPLVDMGFCIDRYEYPGKKGQVPRVSIRWSEAEEECAKSKKRLCRENEWTMACEGDEMLPYPYGLARDSAACNIDANLPTPATAGREHWRSPVDQREPSGKRKTCVSPFGVFDMTGNVDEWVDGRQGGHPSSSMGGYWGPVRNRCRAVTRAHDEKFSFYQTGFRCCRDEN
jgi:sulfatase modifying factor 1